MYDINPRHSWYISFDHVNVLSSEIPIWFQEWFCWVGPTRAIFPPLVLKYCNNYKDLCPDSAVHLKLITFCCKMGIGWIYQHVLEIHQHKPVPFPRHLCVKIKISWWKKFDIKFLEEKFPRWKNGPITSPITPEKQAYQKKLARQLKGKSKAEIRATLMEALSSLGSDEEDEEEESSSNPFYQNEDDYFGLDM